MSYTNQSTTTLADLISKLNTFLSGTPGWTTHHNPGSGEFAARKTPGSNDIGFASQWVTATPDYLAIYQFHGAAYDSGSDPWDQEDDSGNGLAATTGIDDNERSARITDTPAQFWCFEDDDYFHVVVETAAGSYVHFGAGLLDKFNDWTGGEYAYGHWQNTVSTTTQSLRLGNTVLLDGLCADSSSPEYNNQEERCATVRIEGMDDQGGSSKYGVCLGNQSSSNLGTDRQGPAGGSKTNEARIHILGGYRAGPVAHPFGQFPGTRLKGNCPMYPIVQHYWDRVTGDIYPLGQMPDVRGVQIKDFSAGQEIVEGSDTWVVFPSAKKAASESSIVAGTSAYQGIAYKKVTT